MVNTLAWANDCVGAGGLSQVVFSVTGLQLEYSYVLYINLLEGPDREQHDTTVVDSEIEEEGEGGMNTIRWGLERHV